LATLEKWGRRTHEVPRAGRFMDECAQPVSKFDQRSNLSTRAQRGEKRLRHLAADRLRPQ